MFNLNQHINLLRIDQLNGRLQCQSAAKSPCGYGHLVSTFFLVEIEVMTSLLSF